MERCVSCNAVAVDDLTCADCGERVCATCLVLGGGREDEDVCVDCAVVALEERANTADVPPEPEVES